MNTCIFIGRLTAEPEIKVLDSQDLMATFSLAVQRQYKNKKTNQYDADFFNFVAFGKTADFIHQHIHKGYKIAAESRAKTNSWEEDGKTRKSINFTVQNVQVLDWGKQSNGDGKDK